MTRPPLEMSGGARARQRAAVILAVLSGDCPLTEASRRLGITSATYYALERRALHAMVQALEGVKERHRIAAITRQQVQLEQEVLRLQALVRATQRAAGLPPPSKPSKRRRKSPPRARKMIAHLRAPDDTTTVREG
jgi:hypothetical protein